MQHFHLLTLFPEFFQSPADSSIIGRAIRNQHISVETTNIRDFSDNKHNTVDDLPFGGGGGMVMQVGPIVRCIEDLRERAPGVRILQMSPKGRVFDQNFATELAQHDHVAFLCGHYEGIDDRVSRHVNDLVSLGDFVLTGGEVAAFAMVDAIARLGEGVLGNPDSARRESHTGETLLEHPHYTRPRVFRDQEVPETLLSGDHKKIEQWRRKESFRMTWIHRPELLENLSLESPDQQLLDEVRTEEREKTLKKT